MQQVDDPPSLPVGTEVSAKYKGAFCEAKVRKVVRNIKVKVAYKHGLGSGVVSDDAIKSGQLRVGATVEVKHPDRRENVEGTVMKIQDCSQYTVVFDDGDITTLRRTALCLKSGRHFNESETLDQLPLTHPEHFGNPVVGGRRGRRSRHLHDDSSDDDDESDAKEVINEKEENIGKVVCVESTDSKKKDKEKWFPGLVVSPTAQVTVRIRVKDEYLVRSFKDGRYYTVPKKEATEFTREQAHKQDNAAVQAALEYLDSGVLPTHWDRDSLFGLANSSSEYEEVDSDSSDDEPSEEKDLFIAQLYKYMDDRGTPLNKVPSIQSRDVDFYRLFRAVQKLGGYNRVTSQNQWKSITIRLGFTPITVSVTNLVKQAYKKFLQPYEDFHRKLGCSMLMTPRNANRTKGRSLVRANSVASPKPVDTSNTKETKPVNSSVPGPSTSAAVVVNPPPTNDESENTSESSVEVTVAKAATKRKSSVGAGKVKSLVEKFEEKSKEECDIPLAKIQKSNQRSSERKSSETPNTTRENSPTGSVGTSNKKEKQKKPTNEEKRVPKAKKKDEPAEKTDVADFPVEVGDKLKVYYHEKKVTYEAKVIEISVTRGSPLYLVHYTGWNNRYDEWVPRERIAENLTNNKLKKTRVGGAADKGKQEKTENPPKPPSVVSPAIGKTPTSSVKRGRGRSDSQPPRSTTPCSVASNSSRTKSPAASSVQKRTQRTIPSAARRTSNNISDVSMQTSSDSDSDEPVRRPTRATRDAKGKTPQTSRAKSPASVTATSAKSENSASESEDEEEEADDEEMPEAPSSSAKGRDYDLNQIRSELKGFQELKSPTSDPETDNADQQDSKSESIFDFKPKEEESSDQKNDETTKSSETDSSSDGTDSFADDDSQSSDKTTTLENMTEKLQLKINADKKAMLEKFPMGKVPEKGAPSRIEKIIKESLAEKRQESLKAKPFIAEETLKMPKTEVKLEPIEAVTAPATEKKPFPMLLESATKPTVNLTRIGKYPVIIDKPLTIKEPPPEPVTDPLKLEEPSDVKDVLQPTPSQPPQPTSDIYEFKEPEPFEFEVRKTSTTVAASSADTKKKPAATPSASKPTPEQPTVSPLSTSSFGKKKKASPIKDSPEKAKQSKLEEKISVSSLSAAMSNLLTPQKTETTAFDALRKSPSFNLNFNALHEELATTVQETTRALTDVPPPEQMTPTKCGEDTTENPTRVVGSPFIETTCDLSNVFELNQDAEGLASSDEAKDNKFELENVKILLGDSSFDLEPMKVEKPSSIADKVLRAISQKKEEEEKNKCEVSIKPEEVKPPKESIKDEEEVKMEVDNLPSTSNSSTNTSNSNSNSSSSPVSASPFISEPPKIEDVTCTLVKTNDFEITTKRPMLTSPEPKIGILESIPVKNNVLNETIQKLECAIQKTTATTPSVDQFVDESSDSNDSEERLIIEDEEDPQESVRTTTPVVEIKLQQQQPQQQPAPASIIEVKKPEDPLKTSVPIPVPVVPEVEMNVEEVEKKITELPTPPSIEIKPVEAAPVHSIVLPQLQQLPPPQTQSQPQPVPTSIITAAPPAVTIQPVIQVLPQPKLPSPVPPTKSSLVVSSIFNLPQTFYSDPNLQPEDGVKPIFDIRPVEVCASQPPERPLLEPVSIIEQVVPVIATSAAAAASASTQPLESKKDDQATAESLNLHNESINNLLCEETIPGSPCSMVGKDVLDPLAICRGNSHPTESDIKPVPMDIECSTPMSKPPPPMEVPTKPPGPTPNSSPNDSASQDESGEDVKKQADIENEVSPKKRRRTRKQSEMMMMEAQAKRRRPLTTVKKTNGSDSEDNSDTISQRSSSSRHNRPCQYNFLVQLDPSMNPDQRIAILLKQIQDLRKTYNMIKGDLASIDRRRKKMRRREREKKQMQLHQQAIKINS